MVQARAVLDSVILLTFTTAICERAAILEPSVLRSLNALHLSAALEIGDELDALVTYDQGPTEAARILGVRVLAPAGEVVSSPSRHPEVASSAPNHA